MGAKRLALLQDIGFYEAAARKARRTRGWGGFAARMDSAVANVRAALAVIEGTEHERSRRPLVIRQGATRQRRDVACRRGGDSGDDPGLADEPPPRSRGPPLHPCPQTTGAARASDSAAPPAY